MTFTDRPPPARAVPTSSRWPWLVFAAGLIVLFVTPKLFQHAAAHTGDLDTGNYSNFAWSIAHGQSLVAVHGRHHFGEHFSPIMFLVAPLYWVAPTAYTLMVLQALAAVATILLVLHFAERQLRDAGLAGPTTPDFRLLCGAALTILFLLYPPLLASWRTQFQPIELGMPLVVAAVMLLHARRDAWLGVAAVLLLMTRESAPLAVLGLAIYAGGALRRWRVAVVLALAAGIWAWATLGVVMPYFREVSTWRHERWIAPGEIWHRKSQYLFVIFLGTGGLGLLGRSAMFASLAAVPGALMNLAVGLSRMNQVSFENHYDAEIAPFLMIGAAHGTVWLLRRPIRPKHLAFAMAAVTLIGGLVSGSLSSKGPVQGFRDWWPDEERLAFASESRSLGRRYSAAPALAAWNTIGPQVCHRASYQTIRAGKTIEEYWQWAESHAVPGMILLVPRTIYTPAIESLTPQLLRTGGRAKLVEIGALIEVWQWPTDAPLPGTPEAQRYVRGEATTEPSTEPTTRRKRRPTPRPTTTAPSPS